MGHWTRVSTKKTYEIVRGKMEVVATKSTDDDAHYCLEHYRKTDPSSKYRIRRWAEITEDWSEG